ncbi:lipoyl(octanoyl) transferase LipB [Vibrio palustris]|uniref:Octanoyltransferase n=1 Tax=Vibrio palustris TaxID=1918946 RepID=A0A1R4B196_9VIBR|nr:lipoyl(octanoyl) transferase LipB [Vibrio palustris]SJL82690.1 Octanoyltransferase [Vibrio palustris]
MSSELIIRQLGQQDYQPVWQAMQDFTDHRDSQTRDEIWLVEHFPVFTQGQAGKPEHLINTGDIPVVQSDRGGQVTYHGPGQLVVYFLINLRRKSINVRQLVSNIETIVINTLAQYGVESAAKPDAPGVYVESKKICSLGLRIRRGCSFHGLALNINMDLSPFLRINPCGYAGMEMIQLSDIIPSASLHDAESILITELVNLLEYDKVEFSTEAYNHE